MWLKVWNIWKIWILATGDGLDSCVRESSAYCILSHNQMGKVVLVCVILLSIVRA